MIIQIRGTSGSGKTTVMREVMSAYSDWAPVYESGRKKPLYYSLGDLAVLGHYEATCGGCDNVGSAAAVFELIKRIQIKHSVILCEGLLLSEDTKWSLQMTDLRVVFLSTPLVDCLKRIRERRAKAGNEKPLNENNTRNRVAVIERARLKLTAAGVLCRRASSEQAPKIVLDWIRQATR